MKIQPIRRRIKNQLKIKKEEYRRNKIPSVLCIQKVQMAKQKPSWEKKIRINRTMSGNAHRRLLDVQLSLAKKRNIKGEIIDPSLSQLTDDAILGFYKDPLNIATSELDDIGKQMLELEKEQKYWIDRIKKIKDKRSDKNGK